MATEPWSPRRRYHVTARSFHKAVSLTFALNQSRLRRGGKTQKNSTHWLPVTCDTQIMEDGQKYANFETRRWTQVLTDYVPVVHGCALCMTVQAATTRLVSVSLDNTDLRTQRRRCTVVGPGVPMSQVRSESGLLGDRYACTTSRYCFQYSVVSSCTRKFRNSREQ